MANTPENDELVLLATHNSVPLTNTFACTNTPTNIIHRGSEPDRTDTFTSASGATHSNPIPTNGQKPIGTDLSAVADLSPAGGLNQNALCRATASAASAPQDTVCNTLHASADHTFSPAAGASTLQCAGDTERTDETTTKNIPLYTNTVVNTNLLPVYTPAKGDPIVITG